MGERGDGYPVLEEAGVQVLVEPVLELDVALLPDDLVGEGDVFPDLELLPVPGPELDVDDLWAVDVDRQLLVQEDVEGRGVVFVDVADDAFGIEGDENCVAGEKNGGYLPRMRRLSMYIWYQY